MFCEKCGEGLSDGVEFCPKCGTKVGSSVGTPKNAKGWVIPSVIGIIIIIVSFAIPKDYSNDGYYEHIVYLTPLKIIVLIIGILLSIVGLIMYIKKGTRKGSS
jgi:hypothetical protein